MTSDLRDVNAPNGRTPKNTQTATDRHTATGPRRGGRHALERPRRRLGRLTRVLAVGVAAGALVAGAFTAPQVASAATWTLGPAVATDTFKRNVATGFGSAELGGAYSSSTPAGMSVANGAASVVFPASGVSRQAVLGDLKIADVQAATKIVVPKLPAAGNGLYVGIQTRSNGKSYYQATLRILPNGSAYLSTSRYDGSATAETKLTTEKLVLSGIKAGATLNLDLRTRAANTVVVASRAWIEGSAAPGWQQNSNDTSAARIASGGVGLWTYLSGSTTPLTVQFTSLSAAPVTTTDPNPDPPVTPTAPAEPAAPVTPAEPAAPAAPATDTQVSVSGRGSAPIGTTSYPIPADAKYVKAGNGSSGTGTVASPYTSLAYAISKAPSGSTLVLRAGTYRESTEVTGGKKLTIQSYPKETVWLDGSDTVTGWKKSTVGWAVTGWNTNFDTSPTFTKGASDGSAEAIKFINPDYPLAAYPDQVWIGGAAQKQVASEKAVVAGSFFVDRSGKRLILGTDPTGKTVTASKRQTALAVKTAGSTVRGIGVRNYGNSVYQMGAITAQNDSITFENLVVQDNATIGMYAWGTGVTFANITATGNGMMGGGANSADKFTLKNSVISGNNVQNFNRMPVSGGFKITRSRTVAFTNNDFQNNTTVGLWLDESVYNGTVVGNRSLTNGATGVILEISDTFTVANNVIAGNKRYGLWIGNTGNVQVWNNTISGNTMAALQLTQDTRRQTKVSSAGHDRRQTLPDMTVPWIIKNVTISNNVISGSGGGCLVCVEDQSKEFTAEQMKLTLNGNLYQRGSASAPSLAVRWGQGAAAAKSFATVAAFTQATGQEKRSALVNGTSVLTTAYQLTSAALTQSASVVVAVPASVAALTGQQAGAAPARAGSMLTS